MKRITLGFDEELVQQIDDYAREYGIHTRTEAIRLLIASGLKAQSTANNIDTTTLQTLLVQLMGNQATSQSFPRQENHVKPSEAKPKPKVAKTPSRKEPVVTQTLDDNTTWESEKPAVAPMVTPTQTVSEPTTQTPLQTAPQQTVTPQVAPAPVVQETQPIPQTPTPQQVAEPQPSSQPQTTEIAEDEQMEFIGVEDANSLAQISSEEQNAYLDAMLG